MQTPGNDMEATDNAELRSRVLAATASIVRTQGRDAATTRAVAAAAGTQVPAIYRIFGDKQGLLDALAESTLSAFMAEKMKITPPPDPVEALRHGWNLKVEFDLAHPELFAIMSADPDQISRVPSMTVGLGILRQRIRNIAKAGRLAVSEELALDILQSSAYGVILTLLRKPERDRLPELAEEVREMAISTITREGPVSMENAPRNAAITLKAALHDAGSLTPGEKHLMEELLERLAKD